jgi:hypothetical protein
MLERLLTPAGAWGDAGHVAALRAATGLLHPHGALARVGRDQRRDHPVIARLKPGWTRESALPDRSAA